VPSVRACGCVCLCVKVSRIMHPRSHTRWAHSHPTQSNPIQSDTSCFDRSIPCELAIEGKRGAAPRPPSPTQRVEMILTVADFGSLAECYAQGIVRVHDEGLMCRRQALRVLCVLCLVPCG
jgi:hypothetical protein